VSDEGHDGEIYLTLATSAKELSESLAIEAEAVIFIYYILSLF